MGDPLKVKIGEEEIYLCCKACAKGTIAKAHWVTIHRNFAAAQGICPVMEKPLPANPKSTVVDGQLVYICCPPCSKKIQTEPKKYLTKVAGYYQTALRNPSGPAVKVPSTDDGIAAAIAQLPQSDRLRAQVQRICPVSGEQLGTMGIPLKVRVGAMDVFLCCEGCKQGKISKAHWATVASNLKAAQSICPVMGKELPANAKSAVVDGRLVFVCCPPCTKKIAAEPAKYMPLVDAYYKASVSGTNRVAGRMVGSKR